MAPPSPEARVPGDQDVRIVLADDQLMIREALAVLLGRIPHFEVVAQVGNGEAAVRAARELTPDLVVMDIQMPVMDGVEATRRIMAPGFHVRPIRVLVLTTYMAEESALTALREGASGFLLKDRAPVDLVRAIEAVAAGETWLDPAVGASVLRDLRRSAAQATGGELHVHGLTSRETEILQWMAQGLPNADIAGMLHISEATVKTHVNHIFAKLGVRDRAQAVVAAYRSGLVVPAGPGSPPATAGR